MSPRPVPRAERGATIALGPRLRAARSAQGLTIRQVAEAASLTTGFVSRLERDEAQPSVASLVAVCDVLGLRVGALFDPPETSVVRAGEGRDINYGGRGAHEQVVTPRAHPSVQVIRGLIDGGGHGGTDLYTLACEVETVHVTAGALVLVLGTEETVLRAGDTMTFAGHQAHTWRNASASEPCHVLWILVPAP